MIKSVFMIKSARGGRLQNMREYCKMYGYVAVVLIEMTITFEIIKWYRGFCIF
jgi:hypothetical protein